MRGTSRLAVDQELMWENSVMTNVRNLIAGMLKDESGASAAEYALILAIVTTGIAGAAVTLGNVISTAIEDSATCISTFGTSCAN